MSRKSDALFKKTLGKYVEERDDYYGDDDLDMPPHHGARGESSGGFGGLGGGLGGLGGLRISEGDKSGGGLGGLGGLGSLGGRGGSGGRGGLGGIGGRGGLGGLGGRGNARGGLGGLGGLGEGKGQHGPPPPSQGFGGLGSDKSFGGLGGDKSFGGLGGDKSFGGLGGDKSFGGLGGSEKGLGGLGLGTKGFGSLGGKTLGGERGRDEATGAARRAADKGTSDALSKALGDIAREVSNTHKEVYASMNKMGSEQTAALKEIASFVHALADKTVGGFNAVANKLAHTGGEGAPNAQDSLDALIKNIDAEISSASSRAYVIIPGCRDGFVTLDKLPEMLEGKVVYASSGIRSVAAAIHSNEEGGDEEGGDNDEGVGDHEDEVKGEDENEEDPDDE